MNHHSNHHQPKKLDPGSRLLTSDLAELEEELSQDKLAEIWARRAHALAEPPPADTSGPTLNVLVGLLGGERYGLEVSHVREIYPLAQLTPVPCTPDFVAGIFSARGRLISVIDLRAFLNLPNLPATRSSEPPEQQGTSQTKIVVVATPDLEIGLLVDEVVDVVTVFKDELESILTTQMSRHAELVQGLAPGMLVVLNLKALLKDKRLIIHEGVVTS
jgi:purine-binding chemotaxis protein CheW